MNKIEIVFNHIKFLDINDKNYWFIINMKIVIYYIYMVYFSIKCLIFTSKKKQKIIVH